MKLSLWPRPNARHGDALTTLFDRVLSPPMADHLPEVFRNAAIPAANIAENEAAISVALELPGLAEKDIDVQVLGNQLVVTAERKFEEEKKDKEFHHVEHQYGSFSRTVSLPTGLRTDDIDAVYKRGILTVTIPKLEPKPATKVKVKAED
jgi:HSP20 family protein